MLCVATNQLGSSNGTVTQQPTSGNGRGPDNVSHVNPYASYSSGDKAMLIEPGGSLGRGKRRVSGSRIGSRRGIHKNKKPEVRPWSSGLFSCFQDTSSCMWGLFCSPCLAGRIAERLGENKMVPCLPGGCAALRVKLRTEHNIKGEICSDFGVMCCCGCPLALCQMSRELDNIEKNSPAQIRSQIIAE